MKGEAKSKDILLCVKAMRMTDGHLNLLDEKMAHKRRVVCTRKFIINCHQVRILKQLYQQMCDIREHNRRRFAATFLIMKYRYHHNRRMQARGATVPERNKKTLTNHLAL